MMRIYLEVVGCTANKSDAGIVRYQIENDSQYQLVDSVDDADTVILFTCTVISSTEQRMLSKIRLYQKQKKNLVVTGCMAGIQQKEIKNIDPDILCIPPSNVHHIGSYLKNSLDKKGTFEKWRSKKQYESIVAPIAISEGCDFSCSYCITTLARGRLQSYPMSDILDDVTDALDQGCMEIQLTAQDTASYGLDNDSSLAELLKRLSSIQGGHRFRVGMMNPATVIPQLDRLIDAFDDEHIYQFLHLPVQSGDNSILERMGRKYTIEDVEHIVHRFRLRFSDITLATDVIVGFPGEDEKAHQKTMKFLEKLHPDVINITKFSARPFTPAKTLPGRVPTDVVKHRSRQLTRLASTRSLDKNKQHIGKQYRVLITEQGKDDTMVGRTDQNKPVVVSDRVSIGSVVSVEIVDAKQTYFVGMLK